jgi:hypothetical protein
MKYLLNQNPGDWGDCPVPSIGSEDSQGARLVRVAVLPSLPRSHLPHLTSCV